MIVQILVSETDHSSRHKPVLDVVHVVSVVSVIAVAHRASSQCLSSSGVDPSNSAVIVFGEADESVVSYMFPLTTSYAYAAVPEVTTSGLNIEMYQ